jgi:predicted nucleotidyltransferase
MLSNEVREALQKVCSILNKHNVDYIVVGGTAVGFYGYRRVSGISVINPQITTDLDFWYKPSLHNYLQLVHALKKLGVDTSTLDHVVFDPQKTFLKIPHSHFHMDFLPQMTGLDNYADCKKKALREVIDGNEIHILSYEDLIKNKTAVGRLADQNDLFNLGN